MKTLCYRRPDNSIALGHPGHDAMAAMTGDGGLVDPLDVDIGVAKHLVDAGSLAEFEADWSAFLDARRGTDREVKVRAYLEAVAVGGLTEAEALDRIDGKDRPGDCVSYRAIEETDLPADDLDRVAGHVHYRGAWEDDGTAITVNMAKAPAIHIAWVALVRLIELDKLDELEAETSDPAELTAIADRRQTVTNVHVPTLQELARHATPDALKADWPAELPQP